MQGVTSNHEYIYPAWERFEERDELLPSYFSFKILLWVKFELIYPFTMTSVPLSSFTNALGSVFLHMI